MKSLLIAAILAIPTLALAQVPASSKRSKAAARKVTPALKEDLAKQGLQFGDPVFLRAYKEEAELELHILNPKTKKFELFRTYTIAGTSGNLGPKQKEGDLQIPEGFYSVDAPSMNPNSSYHLSFNIGYPNEYDKSRNRTGSYIMVHGSWISVGCLAMTDSKIEEIYTLCDAALRNGQKSFDVHIFPFRMTNERMEQAKGSKWIGFWKNIRKGHDWFEKHKTPPSVSVKRNVYHFSKPDKP